MYTSPPFGEGYGVHNNELSEEFFDMSINGPVLNFSVNGTVKEIYQALKAKDPSLGETPVNSMSLVVQATCVVYYYRSYSTIDYHTEYFDTFAHNLLDPHIYSDCDPADENYIPTLSAIPTTAPITADVYPAYDGCYDPVNKEYDWYYEFIKEGEEEDGEWYGYFERDETKKADCLTETGPSGTLYGVAYGTLNTGSKNSIKLSDLMNSDNEEFINSFTGEKPRELGGKGEILIICHVTLTFADGKQYELDIEKTNNLTSIVAPCMHACTVCGFCTVTDEMLPCNFDQMMYDIGNVCICDEPSVPNYEITTVSEKEVTIESTDKTVKVVVDKIEVEETPSHAFIINVTDAVGADKVLSLYNIDVFDEYDYPYTLNQWYDAGEELTVTVPISKDEAQALQNGEAALYHILADGTAEKVDGVTVTIEGDSASMTFTSDSFSPYVLARTAGSSTPPTTYIESASATITEPVAGANPDFNIVSADESKYTVTVVKWNLLDGSSYPVLTSGDKFERGESYQLDVKFVANPGYEFSDSCVFNVNGVPSAAYSLIKGERRCTFDVYEIIDTINVKGVVAPVAGETPDVSGITSDTDGIKVIEVKWRDKDGYAFEGNPFVAGEKYILWLKYETESGYKVADDAKVTFNISDSNILDKEITHPIIKMTYEVPAASGSEYTKKGDISAVEATATIEPVLGATTSRPSFTITVPTDAAAKGVNIPSINWYKKDASNIYGWTQCSNGVDTFEEGTYRLSVQLRSESNDDKEYYAMSDATTFAVNDVQWNSEEPFRDFYAASGYGYRFFVSPEFTLGGKTLDSIAVTTPPTKTVYRENDDFSPDGMVVTATYTDSSTAPVYGYTVTDGAAMAAGKTSVTISYTEGGVTKTTTQAITVAKEYTVTVNGGTGNGKYVAGEKVTISAFVPSGTEFKEWQGVDELTFTSGGKNTSYAIFTMPASDVTVTAVTGPAEYLVSVTGGSGTGTYEVGEIVTITADPPESGKQFKQWKENYGTVLRFVESDITSSTAKFVMPGKALRIEAEYEDITGTYTVTFNANGHGTAPDKIENVASGSTVDEPTAPTADGWIFGGWYKDAGCTNEWDFANDTVTSDIVLFAKWTEDGSTPSHNPSGDWTKDETHHWHKCIDSGCEEKLDYAAHDDADGDNLCDACGYDMTPSSHTHDWTDDDHMYEYIKSDGHAHSCTGCTEFDTPEAHFDNDGDELCDECGYSVPSTVVDPSGEGISLAGPFIYDTDPDYMFTEVEAESVFEYGEPVYYLIIDETVDGGRPIHESKYVEKLKVKANWNYGGNLIESVKVIKKYVSTEDEAVGTVCQTALDDAGFESGYYYFLEVVVADKATTADADIFGTVEFNRKANKRKSVEEIDECKLEVDFTVFYPNNWNRDGEVISDRADLEWYTEYALKFNNDEEVELSFGSPSNGNNEGTFTVDISGQGKIYLYYTTEGIDDITAANPSAKMDFLTFYGVNGVGVKFNRVGEFVYEMEDGAYAYKIVDGELIEMPDCYSEQEEAFVFNTGILGSYVFSDTQLILPKAE